MGAWVRDVSRWLFATLRWVFSRRRFWLTIAVLAAVVFLASVIPACWETRLRLAGLVLQIAGVLTVAVGLHQTRRLFKRRSDLLQWLDERPRFRRDVTVQISGAAALALAGDILAAAGRASPPPNPTVEQRLAALETGQQETREQVEALRQSADRNKAEQASALQTEAKEREKADSALRSLLEDAMVGGLTLEAMGVTWLLFGLVLATAPGEIAGMFGASACR